MSIKTNLTGEQFIQGNLIWRLLGYIMLIGCLGLISIFAIIILFDVASFFNYTTNGYFIGGVISLFTILLIFKLSIVLINRFEV